LLEKNPDKINWYYFSQNTSERAMRLLEKYPNKISWGILSRIPSAIQLLKKHPNKICWSNLFLNPHIFKYDYNKMKQNRLMFKEDLMKNRFHPRNISKFRDWGINGFNSY